MRFIDEWIKSNEPKEGLLFKDALYNQIDFVRDVAEIFARSIKEFDNMIKVDGTHMSKSVNCPVYHIELKDFGVRIWMRYNFYNWNVSIDSDNPITCDFLGTFNDDFYDNCYCEGMTNHKFGKYGDNNKRFTVYIKSEYNVYAFFLCIKNFLKIKSYC